MSRPITQRYRRTYFNNPAVEETLRFLPAALDHPTSVNFRAYLTQNLPQNSLKTRERLGQYIAHRFSQDGRMNLHLALALKTYGDSRTSREILYFEYLQSVPILQEIASLWLAELPAEGAPRSSLLEFLAGRIGGRNSEQIVSASLLVFRRCLKAMSKSGVIAPLRAEPPREAFLYVLARLYPEPAMVRIDAFAGLPLIRGMLWPRPVLETLLSAGVHAAGHVSKVSELDQYSQFTLAGSGEERLRRLLGAVAAPTPRSADPEAAAQLNLPLRTKR